MKPEGDPVQMNWIIQFYPKIGLDGATLGTSQTKKYKCIGSNMVNHAQDWSWVKIFFDLPNKHIPTAGSMSPHVCYCPIHCPWSWSQDHYLFNTNYYCYCDPKIVNLNLDMLSWIPRKGFQSKYYSHLFGLLHQENAFSGNNIMCEERHWCPFPLIVDLHV